MPALWDMYLFESKQNFKGFRYLSTQNQNSDSKVIEHKGLLKLSSQNLQIHLEANLKVTKMSDVDILSVKSFLTLSFFQQVLLVASKLHFGLDFQ